MVSAVNEVIELGIVPSILRAMIDLGERIDVKPAIHHGTQRKKKKRGVLTCQ